MALPAPPGAPTPTPTPMPAQEGDVTPADYAQTCYDNLANGNNNDTFTRKEVLDWFGTIKDALRAAEL